MKKKDMRKQISVQEITFLALFLSSLKTKFSLMRTEVKRNIQESFKQLQNKEANIGKKKRILHFFQIPLKFVFSQKHYCRMRRRKNNEEKRIGKKENIFFYIAGDVSNTTRVFHIYGKIC
jgi:hypothetical protein